VVREIFDDVRARGGQAVTDWSLKLDKAAPRRIAITPDVVSGRAMRWRPPMPVRCASQPTTSASSTR
jgi:histidinol dehydrogenase